MKNSDELQRLKLLYEEIKSSSRYESSFDSLYQLMQNEYPDQSTLKSAIFRPARVYLAEKKKHPVRGNLVNYQEFVSDFMSLITHKIATLEAANKN